MSLVDRLNNQAIQLGNNAKAGAQNLFLLSCKVLTGLLLGLTFSLVGQEVFHYQPVLFWFVIVAITAIFYKISKAWGGVGLLIFDLLCVLAALLIRMYVVIAPG